MKYLIMAQRLLDQLRWSDFLAPLALRLYLVPIFWMAGTHKWADMDSIITWFGEGLGLPFPTVMAYLATGTEIIGAVALLIGLGVRWISVPLMVTMLVAIVTVHADNGWLAVAEGPDSLFATERTTQAIARLDEAKTLLQQHGDYERLTEHGSLVMLNNGIEFATTYFIMLLALFFMGAGRFVSLDYWIRQAIFKSKPLA